VARGRILAFSIDMLRRLENTLAVQCKCEIFAVSLRLLISQSK